MFRKIVFTLLLTSVLVGALSAGALFADEEKRQSKAEKRLAKIEEKYQPTGKTRTCVPFRSLRNSTVIDDNTIFFKGVGKRAYMNRFLRSCPRLAIENRFAYATSASQLCRGEIITVLDVMGSAWGSCALGEFEEWERKPKDIKEPAE
jgi:hypothetical protein